jgi:predicted type IV restriction endonuclease
MAEQLLTFITNLKSDKRISSFDEAATKQAIILRLLSLLSWDTFNVDEVYPEYSVGTKRVDYSLRIDGVNEVFLEAKKPGEELENHQEQLLDYSFREGIRLAILTNGVTWWFYLPLHAGTWEQRKFYSIDVFQQDPRDVVLKFVDFLARENVRSGKAFDNAEAVYRSQQRQKILQATLPKAWDMIISEPDRSLVELISETAEKISGYKPDDDMIEKFLSKYRVELSERLDRLFPADSRTKATPPSVPDVLPPTLASISEDFTGKKISSFYFRGEKREVRSWKELLVELCSTISIAHGSDFGRVLTLRGSKRPYFTRDKSQLSGKAKPERIANTDIFMETNLSARNTTQICRRLIALFGYSDDDLKIELEVE